MKVAIVYDRVNKFGGAERFLQSLLTVFPKAPLYTLVHSPESSSWVGSTRVVSSFLNKFPFFRTRHEILAPISALAFETHNLNQFDLVISVTSADAKSVITLPHQVHICICLTPTRYLWSGHSVYKKDYKLRFLPSFLHRYFRFVDLVTSTRPDYYIAISKEVKKRIKKYYQKDSVVIYPPLDKKFLVKRKTIKKRNQFLIVSRLVPYKKVRLVIQLFNKLNKNLVIIGTGSDEKKLRKIAKENITFLGEVSDEVLFENYEKAKAVIFPQREDFGLVSLEAQSFGTPVIAYGRGGGRETVIDGKTGVLFKRQTEDSLRKALSRFKKIKFSRNSCIQNAHQYSLQKFKEELLSFVNQRMTQSS